MSRVAPSLVALLLLTAPSLAAAEGGPWVGASVLGGPGFLLTAPQTDFYGNPGAAGFVRAGGSFWKYLGLELEGGLLQFPAKSGGTAGAAGLVQPGVRLLPLPDLALGLLYVDAHAGLAFTGVNKQRFAFEAGAGFDFEFSGFTVGPFVRYQRVVAAPAPTELPGDASVLVAGVSVGFLKRLSPPKPVVVAPPPDRDHDGVPDAEDGCPDEPEDKDGFRDDDGCPDPDNDKDGVLDAADRCPTQPETKNDFEDEDGCPDEAPVAFLSETQRRIIISDRIFFETASDKLLPESFGVLKAVAQVMAEHPELPRIRIEGHTDDVGTDGYNQTLSQRRAESVMAFLIRQGVDPGRLAAKGFGKSRPLVDATNEEARAANRRVEFTVETAREPTSPSGKAK